MKFSQFPYKLLTLLLLGIIISGCSVEKNTGSTRAFHNLISRYNIYFNGKEAYKKGVRKVDKTFIDDFSETLPIFKYADENVARTISPEMDKAITKSTKVISLHSITAKPNYDNKKNLSEKEEEFYSQNEFNNWVDDSYLLMAKAQFHKLDYFISLKTFKYVTEEASDLDVIYEALIWTVRVYNEEGSYGYSKEILVSLEEDPDLPKDLHADFYSTYADYYLKREMYDEVVPVLEKLLNIEKKKKNKTRYTYILAQANENLGNMNEAYRLYAKVVKMNPTYDMTFNARINQAESFDVTIENVSEIKKILRKMLRDDKNTDYFDQIYYAFGNIALKENKQEEAIQYFKKSAQASISNNKQKGISYLTIADLYFKDENYYRAQPYYDSAMIVLDQSFPGYGVIEIKKESLNRLVQNINTVQIEDSLQRMAAMGPADRLNYIDEVIVQVKAEDEKQRENQEMNQYNLSNQYETDQRVNQELAKAGNWYFYNPAVVGLGRNEFRQRWGNRQLEDNWRRKNKSISEANMEEIVKGEEGIDAENGKTTVKDKYSREYYLKDLPLTDSLIQESNTRIETSMYKIGQIYLDELKDDSKAAGSFEALILRFPGTSYSLAAYYYLYELSKENGNQEKSNFYKNKIITNYPESEFAKMLSDPDYLRKRNELEREDYLLYEDLYKKYLIEQYNYVIVECERFISSKSDHDLTPKYRLLKAYAIAKVSNIRDFKEALNDVVENSPDGQEKDRAKELIAFYNEEIPELKEEEEVKISVEIYKVTANEEHIVVFSIEDASVDANQLMFNIINYNLDNYSHAEFSTNLQDVGDKGSMISIRGVGKKKETTEYLIKILKDKSITDVTTGKKISTFVISESNLGVFLENKSVSVYLKFYGKNYLGNN
ncbi:MAG: hypothetical protein QNK30_13340 [Bacteroidales bacterium]|nr:hypothetical protein [Bacteroidales bacterium]